MIRGDRVAAQSRRHRVVAPESIHSRRAALGRAAERQRPRHGDEPSSTVRARLIEGRVKYYFVLSQFTPMAPTQVREPFHRDGWVYEEKVDGWRMLAYKDGARVRLISRNGRDHTRRFHDIAAAVAPLRGGHR